MVFVLVKLLSGKTQCLTLPNECNVLSIRAILVPEVLDDSLYLTCDGRRLADTDKVQDGGVYHVAVRLPGGKGGFGSMLRAIGAQIEKTISKEACRDLSGRRMRDINNEKKLREWVAKQAEREREREEKRRERMERRKSGPKHNFDDPDYEKQKAQVTENLEDALQQGLRKAAVRAGTSAPPPQSRKRKAAEEMPEEIKRQCKMLGINIDNLSDFSSDNDDSDDDDDTNSSSGSEAMTAFPGTSYAQPSTSTASDITMTTVTMETAVSSSCADKDTTEDEQSCDNTQQTGETPAVVTSTADHSDIADNTDVVTDGNCGVSSSACDSAKKESDENKPDSSSQNAGEDEPEDSKKNTEKADTGKTDTKKDLTELSGPVDLEQFSSAEELEKLGLDRLKGALMELGLKCGGTLQERAQRLFSIKGLSREQYNPALFAKPSRGKKK